MYGDSLVNDRLVVLLAADNSLRQSSVRVQFFSRNGTVPCNAYSLGNIEIQNKIVVKKEIMDFNIEQILLRVQPVMTAAKLKHNTQQLKTYCSSNDLTYMNERTTVMGYGRSEAGKVTAAYNRVLKQEQEKLNKMVDISGGSGIINKSTVNAVGKPVEIVERTEIKGKPNSITQKETAKGGIDRNYYGDDGMQTKQISNNDHGNPKNHPFGKNGEHAHDYHYNEKGKLIRGSARDLTDDERKENEDII